MKKTISILVAAVMLFSTLAVFAAPSAKNGSVFPEDAGAPLEGYIVGDGAGSAGTEWVSFNSENPEEVEILSSHLTTYGAACYQGTVYGYVWGYDSLGVLHDEFYSIDLNTRVPVYYEDTHSGVIVYGMAYDYSENVMYALCDDEAPYLASVDLLTGALTRVLTIQLGSVLGVYGLAIDMEGNIYCITLSAISSRLVKVNRQNGSLTELANSGKPAYYAQCITYDPSTNRIYWAEVDGPNTATNGLYSFDLSNNYAFAYHGIIGTNFELMAMYSTAKVSAAGLTGDANGDGEVNLQDALVVLRAALGLIELGPAAETVSDVNGDGAITIDDALLILRFALGLTGSL